MEYKSREDLFNRIVSTFSDQSEVREITIFGRNAEGTSDEYSDLDIRVHSNDPLKTQEKYLQLISETSPILETLLLVSDTENLAQMIMLKDCSPYQKVDFGICSGNSIFTPSITIYKNEKAIKRNSKLEIVPMIPDIRHDLNNFLFGVPRITKCFFREDMDMYRRWKGMTNHTLVLLFEKYNGYQEISPKRELSASESKLLLSQINSDEKKVLSHVFPKNGKLNIADSFFASLKLYVTLSRAKAEHFQVSLNEKFIVYIEEFASIECEKAKQLA